MTAGKHGPTFASFDYGKRSEAEDRIPLNSMNREPSGKSTSSMVENGAIANGTAARPGIPGVPTRRSPGDDHRAGMPAGVPGMESAELGNPMMGGPILRHQDSNGTMQSQRSQGRDAPVPVPFHVRGRGGYPSRGRGGPNYAPRGGPGMGPGFRGRGGAPPPGWRGRGTGPPMGGMMMGRGQPGPPPGYENNRYYGPQEQQDQGPPNMHGAPPMLLNNNPTQAEDYAYGRSPPGPQAEPPYFQTYRGPQNDLAPIPIEIPAEKFREQVNVDDRIVPVEGPNPNTIGQAVEMDANTGTASELPQNLPVTVDSGLDSEQQGVAREPSPQQHQRGMLSRNPSGSVYSQRLVVRTNLKHNDADMSSSTAHAPPRSHWASSQPGSQPARAPPQPNNPPAPAHTHKASSDFYEDVDPRFDVPGPLPHMLEHADSPYHYPLSNPAPNAAIPAYHAYPSPAHRASPAPPVRQQTNQSLHPNDSTANLSRDDSSENLPEGARSPAEGSDASHFTSVSQRGVNPSWRPGLGPGENYSHAPRQLPRQRREDVILEANPDFAIPGVRASARAGARGSPMGAPRRGGMRGGTNLPAPSGMGDMGPYPGARGMM